MRGKLYLVYGYFPLGTYTKPLKLYFLYKKNNNGALNRIAQMEMSFDNLSAKDTLLLK